MLADNVVEEFEMEDEPWYDHRDLQQGEGEVAGGLGGGDPGVAGVESARKFLRLEVWDAAAGGFSRSPGNGSAHPDRREPARAAHGPADAPHWLMLRALRKRLRGMMSGSISLMDF